MPTEITSALISAIIGGVIVSLVNYVLTRKKTSAETEKLKAETEKIRLETEKLTSEIQRLNQSVEETAYYRSSDDAEQIIFDSSKGIDNFDLDGFGGTLSYDSEKVSATGNFSIKQGTAIVERTNTGGCYTLTLRKYHFEGKIGDYLPKNVLAEGKRKIRVSFQAKITSGTSKIVVVFDKKQDKGFEHLVRREISIPSGEWQNIDIYNRVTPDLDCVFKIHQIAVSEPCTLLVKNLIIAEKK